MNTQFNYYDIVVTITNSKMVVGGKYICDVESVEEAKQIAECIRTSAEVNRELSESVRHVSDSDIIVALKENESYRITERTVELFKEAIEQKLFVPSNAMLELRESVGGLPYHTKIDYKLSDGSVVLLDTETNRLLNSLIDVREHYELIQYMVSNSTNFVSVVEQLLEDQ